eukprot:jgi/Bigna1/141840/aug1.65_g16548
MQERNHWLMALRETALNTEMALEEGRETKLSHYSSQGGGRRHGRAPSATAAGKSRSSRSSRSPTSSRNYSERPLESIQRASTDGTTKTRRRGFFGKLFRRRQDRGRQKRDSNSDYSMAASQAASTSAGPLMMHQSHTVWRYNLQTFDRVEPPATITEGRRSRRTRRIGGGGGFTDYEEEEEAREREEEEEERQRWQNDGKAKLRWAYDSYAVQFLPEVYASGPTRVLRIELVSQQATAAAASSKKKKKHNKRAASSSIMAQKSLSTNRSLGLKSMLYGDGVRHLSVSVKLGGLGVSIIDNKHKATVRRRREEDYIYGR